MMFVTFTVHVFVMISLYTHCSATSSRLYFQLGGEGPT